MKPLLRIALTVTGIYLILLGILYIFAPSLAESILQIPLPDRATAMVYGVTGLTVAFLSLAAAIRGQIGLGEYRFLLVFSGLQSAIFGLFIPLGIYSQTQALPLSLIWGVLNGLLVVGGRKKSSLSTP